MIAARHGSLEAAIALVGVAKETYLLSEAVVS